MVAFLFVVPITLVVFMFFVTIYTIKNIKPVNEEADSSIEQEKPKWEHIKDFSNINVHDGSKINAFINGFEDEAKTVGIDSQDFERTAQKEIVKEYPQASLNEAPNKNLQEIKADDFINDFMTVSIDESENLYNLDDDSDATVDMFQEQNRGKISPKIEVTLRYNDESCNKMMKMETSQITVGRSAANDLILRGESYASKNHAVFIVRDGRLYVKDLNSKNGTYINHTNKRIEGEMQLDKSCDVTFGDVTVNVGIIYR